MKKFKGTMISFNELADLEQMVCACAESALRISRLGLGKHAPAVKPEIDQKLLQKLMKCYTRSAFFPGRDEELSNNIDSGEEEDAEEGKSNENTQPSEPQEKTKYQKYKDYIQHNFEAAVKDYQENCLNQTHLNLVLPVLFFSLILQNESNTESVSRRILKIELEGIESTPWKAKNPFKLSKYKNKINPKQQEQFQQTVYSLEAMAIRRSFYSHPMLSEQVSKAMSCAFHIADNYQKVHFFSEHARIGAFLFDILSKTADENKPVDTILRFFMIKQMHDILDWTRLLYCNDPVLEFQKNKYSLLYRFFMDGGAPKEEAMLGGRLPLYYTGNSSAPTTKQMLESDLQKRDHFATYYQYLKSNFNWEIPGFMEYYLDKDTLEKFIGVDKAVLRYARAMKHFIKELPKLEGAYDSAEVISDMEQILSQLRRD